SSALPPYLSHIPIHGPHALANTVAPILLNVSINPSRSIVYLTCSEPGVMVKLALVFSFLSDTCLASDAALDMSSYEEFVQEPINPYSTLIGQLLSLAALAIFEMGVAKSGVNGPFKCGSNSERLISIT